MEKKIYSIVTLFLLLPIVGCYQEEGQAVGFPVAFGYDAPDVPPDSVVVKTLAGVTETVTWPEYLAIVVASEVPFGIHWSQAGGDPDLQHRIGRYVQVLAVAVRSYALAWRRDHGGSRDYDLLAGPSCQNYDRQYWDALPYEARTFLLEQIAAVSGYILLDAKAGLNEPAFAHYGRTTHSAQWTLASPAGKKGMYVPTAFLLPEDAAAIARDLDNTCPSCRGLSQWLLMEHCLSRYVDTKKYRMLDDPVSGSPTNLRSVEEYLSWFYPNYALYRPEQPVVDLGELLRRELPVITTDGGKIYRLDDLAVNPTGVFGVAVNQKHSSYREDLNVPAYNASFSSAYYDGGGPEVGFRVAVGQPGKYELAVSSQAKDIKVSAILYGGDAGQPVFLLANASGVSSGEVFMDGEYFLVLETSSPSASSGQNKNMMPPVRFSIRILSDQVAVN